MYFNEHEPYAAAWLRNLWPRTTVDERSVVDVQPSDLAGHRRVHLFAGIGGWEYALRLAEWPEDREVWTGSCPCQPFSGAGRNDGLLDPRHLWPAFRGLIAERRPSIVFGEQVASAAGRAWLAGVRTDLEDLGYAVGAADLCAASLGAPHIRQRLYWVADYGGKGLARRSEQPTREERAALERGSGVGWLGQSDSSGREKGDQASAPLGHGRTAHPTGGMANAGRERVEGLQPDGQSGCGEATGTRRDDAFRGLGDATSGGRGEQRDAPRERRSGHAEQPGGPGLDRLADPAGSRPAGGEDRRGDSDRASEGSRRGEPARGRDALRPWDDAEWLACRDGKSRRTQRGLSPLVDGVPFRLADGRTREGAARTAMLRGAGNAIVPQVAAEFVRAYLRLSSP